MFKFQEGFTLIELMVVVLIIAILVAIAVPVFNAVKEGAWKRTCQANLRIIDGQIQAYSAETEYLLPANFQGLRVLNLNHPLITGQYLKSVPLCPRTKAEGDVTNAFYSIGDSYDGTNGMVGTVTNASSGREASAFCTLYNPSHRYRGE